jgi:hypothetical protein
MAGADDLTVQVPPTEGEDAGELLAVASRLREELLTLDVDDVRPVEAGTTPDGAKGVAALTGWLAVQLGSAEGLRAVVALVRGWAGRRQREVEVTIGGDTLRISGVSTEEQEKIVDAWLARHAAGS